jgi:hypothetical protein
MNHLEAMQRLEELAALKPNWDSYGAEAINPLAIQCAKAMLWRLGPGWIPVPTSDGGVQLEGSHLECYVEINISTEF